MQATTGILTLQEPGARVLDICMAPGGYSASALKYSPHARVSGISLPPSLGGHPLIIWHGTNDPRVEVLFADVTMFASEYSVTNFPANHPDLSNFSLDRPWANESFNLIFCDGQVLRTHAPHIASYREQCEAGRLTCSQLILAMQRIKPGGSIVMLLHKVEMWQTVKLLSNFDKISELQLFKPLISHKTRGSFYLVAKNLQPYRAEAFDDIKDWECARKKANVPGPADEGYPSPLDSVKKQKLEEGVAGLLANFGERLIELGEAMWKIQKNALKEAPWFKNKKMTPVGDSTGQLQASFIQ